MKFISTDIVNMLINIAVVIATLLAILPQIIDKKDYENLFIDYQDSISFRIVRVTTMSFKFLFVIMVIIIEVPFVFYTVRDSIQGKMNLILDLPTIDLRYYLILFSMLPIMLIYYIIFGLLCKKKVISFIKTFNNKMYFTPITINIMFFVFTIGVVIGFLIALIIKDVFTGITESVFTYIGLLYSIAAMLTLCDSIKDSTIKYFTYGMKTVTILLENNSEIQPKEYFGEYHNLLIVTDEDNNHISINKDKIINIYKTKEE